MDTLKDSGIDSVDRVGVSTIPFAPRYPLPPIQDLVNLGPIAHLAGNWSGCGFNIIWRPDNTSDPGFKVRRFLQLNQTLETLKFETVASAVPNRGLFKQPDINIYGLNYLQKVKDNDVNLPGFPNFPNAGEDLHIEPGLFLNVPASGGVEDPNDLTGDVTDPVIPASIVRLATIPHGVSVLLQGNAPSATPVPGPPKIPPVYPIEAITKAYKDYPDYASRGGFCRPIQGFPDDGGAWRRHPARQSAHARGRVKRGHDAGGARPVPRGSRKHDQQ